MESRIITDKELTLACTLVGEITDYWRNHELAPPHEPLLKLRKPTDIFPAIPSSLTALSQLGWKLVTASHWKEGVNINSENDYEGIILFHPQKKLILLSHRGMQLDSPANVANCLKIGKGDIPKIVDDAISMCNFALNMLTKAKYTNCRIYHTGFSMGGFLSQITASYCNHYHREHNKTICYDAPGAKLALQTLGYNDNQNNIIIYLTHPNLVNTATPHYGYVRQINYFKEKNDYKSSQLKDIAVKKSLAIDANQLITGENFLLAVSTAQSHLELFKSPFNNANNFDYSHVHSWPLARNTFVPRSQPKNSVSAPVIKSSDSFGQAMLKMAHNIGNSYLETQVDQITYIAGVEDIGRIEHQLPNPDIQHHHEAILIQTQNSGDITSIVTLMVLIMLLTIRELNKPLEQQAEQAQEEQEEEEIEILAAMNSQSSYTLSPLSQPNAVVPTTANVLPPSNNQSQTTSKFSKTPGS